METNLNKLTYEFWLRFHDLIGEEECEKWTDQFEELEHASFRAGLEEAEKLAPEESKIYFAQPINGKLWDTCRSIWLSRLQEAKKSS